MMIQERRSISSVVGSTSTSIVFLILVFQFALLTQECSGNAFLEFFGIRRFKGSADVPVDEPPANTFAATAKTKVGCLDESGKSVPWFIVYKLPKLKSASGPTFRKGEGYYYLLPGYDTWKPSTRSIGATNSIVGNTIRPYLESDPALLSIIYNDQPPNRDPVSGNAHSKGIVLSKSNGGLWLMHSVPRFPTNENSTSFFPTNGLPNAQMFLCLTLDAKEIDSTADIFTLIRLHVGNVTVLPQTLESKFPKLKKFLDIKRYSGQTENGIFDLTAGPMAFKIYAKSPKYNKEIYVDWLAPSLKSSLEVQSWLNGVGGVNSTCDQPEYDVYNIEEKTVDGNKFGRSDHSKWAVTPRSVASRSQGQSWVCISDLNRIRGQMSRGGVVLCVSDPAIWDAFTSSIVGIEPCKRIPKTKLKKG